MLFELNARDFIATVNFANLCYGEVRIVSWVRPPSLLPLSSRYGEGAHIWPWFHGNEKLSNRLKEIFEIDSPKMVKMMTLFRVSNIFGILRKQMDGDGQFRTKKTFLYRNY
jgi:hypothetical protein